MPEDFGFGNILLGGMSFQGAPVPEEVQSTGALTLEGMWCKQTSQPPKRTRTSRPIQEHVNMMILVRGGFMLHYIHWYRVYLINW